MSTDFQFESLYFSLLAKANSLRKIKMDDLSEDVLSNIDAAIVHMDCARQNILDQRHWSTDTLRTKLSEPF